MTQEKCFEQEFAGLIGAAAILALSVPAHAAMPHPLAADPAPTTGALVGTTMDQPAAQSASPIEGVETVRYYRRYHHRYYRRYRRHGR